MSVGRKSDTWSLGNILFYLMTFSYPFGDLPEGIMETEQFNHSVKNEEPTWNLCEEYKDSFLVELCK